MPTRRQTMLGFTALGALSGCATPAPTPANPTAGLDADMARVISTLQAMRGKPIVTLGAPEARLQPTAAQAAMRVQQELSGNAEPLSIPRVVNITVQGAAGSLPARAYGPRGSMAPLPLILYFQGGGWVLGDLDTYDASCRALAERSGAVVVSVQYRKAPEHRFPAAHDDAIAVYKWLLDSAQNLGADPTRLALVGEGAGGNLALATAIAARDQALQRPVHQLLIYPVAGTDLTATSYNTYRDAKPLDTALVEWFLAHEISRPADLQDPRLDLVGRGNLLNLPPTTIILAEVDPLRSGGELLASKLRSASVPVAERTFSGVTHAFFGMGAVVAKAREAQEFAAAQLRESFEKAVQAQAAAPSRSF